MKIFQLVTVCLISFAVITGLTIQQANSQSLNVIAGNTLFGAATGAGIGSATMLMINDSNTRPVTFGLGLGTLAGVGIGIYDMTTMSSGMSVHGLFNTAPSSGAIIFLDTLYGSATGSLIGIAVALIGDTSIFKGFRYGIGAGAYAGLGFGLVDAFYFGSLGSQGEFFDYTYKPATTNSRGLVSLFSSCQTSVSTLNFMVEEHAVTSPSGKLAIVDTSFGLEMLRFSLRF